MPNENDETSRTVSQQEVYMTLARLEAVAATTANDVGQLKHTLLEGNGVPSITVQVATLNADMATVKQQLADHRIPRSTMIPMLITIIIAVADILMNFHMKV
jgi:hypothetical protein